MTIREAIADHIHRSDEFGFWLLIIIPLVLGLGLGALAIIANLIQGSCP